MATATWLQPTAFRLGDPGPGLTAEAIEPGLRRLVADPGVRALVLFGSRARGQARPDSDLDLLVVHRDRLSPRGRLEADGKARRLLGDLPVDLDLLVEDAADVERGERFTITVRGRPVADLVPHRSVQDAEIATTVEALRASRRVQGVPDAAVADCVKEGRR